MLLTGTPIDYLIVFLAGVAVSFTPCVYPVMPIVATVVAGANTSGRKVGGFFLSLIYVLGLALSYCLLAVAAALTGKVFGTLQNSPWVFLIVGNIFLLFALVMLDVLHLPILSVNGGVKGKGKLALFSMGFASGCVVGPCTAPVLGTLLFFVAGRQDLLQGIMLLFVFAFGSGVSLILAGTFSGFLASLPKAGPWMNAVKKAAGVVLIILAEIYLIKAGKLFL